MKSHKLLFVVFALCWTYWGYLILNSQMVIQFDAIGYQDLGAMIYKQGWKAFFETGPHREPLYPWLVSIAMNIADKFSVSYQLIQKLLQVVILFITQLMLWALLKRAGIGEGITAMTLLYFGFSPAIVNSALSLYSEIAIFPAVLLIILAGSDTWHSLHQQNLPRVVRGAILTGVGFVWAAAGKGIFQYIFVIFSFPFIAMALVALFKGKIIALRNSAVFLTFTFLILGSFVFCYRYVNKRLNGNFEFTNRYDGNLFGTAAKRVNKLDRELWLAHFASVPGGGVCRSFFSEEDCKYCEFEGMDQYRLTELPKLLEEKGVGVSAKEKTAGTISLSFEKVSENPFQYFALTLIESLKMAFWESTQIGFVTYPAPLKRFFDFGPVKNGIRFLVSLLSYLSLFYVIFYVLANRSKLNALETGEGDATQRGFFVLLIIVSFTGLYSIFSILTRFALPIAALYLFCMAFTAQYFISENLFRKKYHR